MRIIRRILAVIMMACIMITLTGCGHDIVGSWQLTGGNAAQAIYSISDASQLSSSDADATFTFSKDGALTLTMKRDGMENTVNGSWTEEKDNIIITLDGQSVTCAWEVDGDTLSLFFTLYEQNASFIFTRK